MRHERSLWPVEQALRHTAPGSQSLDTERTAPQSRSGIVATAQEGHDRFAPLSTPLKEDLVAASNAAMTAWQDVTLTIESGASWRAGGRQRPPCRPHTLVQRGRHGLGSTGTCLPTRSGCHPVVAAHDRPHCSPGGLDRLADSPPGAFRLYSEAPDTDWIRLSAVCARNPRRGGGRGLCDRPCRGVGCVHVRARSPSLCMYEKGRP